MPDNREPRNNLRGPGDPPDGSVSRLKPDPVPEIKYQKNDLEGEAGDDDDDDDDDDEDDDDDDDDSEKEEEINVRPNWDKFQDHPAEGESISMADTSIIDAFIQVIKLIAYVVTFALVLAGGVLAKSALLLMTSQLTPGRTVFLQSGSLQLSLELPDVERYLWIWSLLIAFALPELGVLVRSVRIAVFKGHVDEYEYPAGSGAEVSGRCIFLVAATMETLHAVGLAVFVFVVLPEVDVVKGVMLTNCICIVPGLLDVIPPAPPSSRIQRVKLAGNVVALLFQLTGLLTWPLVFGGTQPQLWLIPVSLLLVSCNWWMNYVSEDSSLGFVRTLAGIKETLRRKRVFLYRFYMGISVWKILVFFSASLLVLSLQGVSPLDFLRRTAEAFAERDMMATEVDISTQVFTGKQFPVPSIGRRIWWIIGVQALAAYVCYTSGKFACRIMIQPFSFAFPCTLVVPTTVVFIVFVTGLRNENAAAFSYLLPNYVFFRAPPIYKAEEFFFDQFAGVWVLWMISQIWITQHIWLPRAERLSKTEKLFVTPLYSAFLVDQSMTLNRRREETETLTKKEEMTPHIIACATMWHETRPEMLEMLKSLLRMDNDQCLKQSAKNNVDDPEAESNFYTFEAHVFFDDAFEIESEENTRPVVNGFVRDFLKTVRRATKSVYGTDDRWIKPPVKFATPYGGRLVYTMPGENKLVVHLKDKDRIRHRKRWSQVMYMYYLLGYKLMNLPDPYERKMEKAENTFILALDGDIDFKPDAVLLLVDLMKKNNGLGAACGRIHPVGSGFMVWYQLFEYAIGHWLQKATEHMVGCVLCSPGCFSLFRGKALMSPNVMKRYTTRAEEARHYVQYDQGEDRWLCTLLLQRGYRVEYSAASDAYTHCPETFNEFYTQRRRWIPSTLANIIDLLSNYKRTVEVNNDISLPYICYQTMLLVGTILGPGTILLMLVGAFNSVFKIDNWTALYLNLTPIFCFIVCCLFTSGKFQLFAALVISLLYGLIMMAVLVGVAMEIKDDGLFSPSSLFLFTTVAEVIIAGLIHPQEMLCLLSGVTYYVSIPSMYLLLIIYSVCNLNVVTWGTREVAKKKTKADLENEKREAELAEKKAQKMKLFGILDTFSGHQEKETSGALEFSLANVFRCFCCTSDQTNSTGEHYVKIGETLNGLMKKMDDLERAVQVQQGANASDVHVQARKSTVRMSILGKPQAADDEASAIRGVVEEDSVPCDDGNGSDADAGNDDPENPYWLSDRDLRNSKSGSLTQDEVAFWNELIKSYLHPLEEDKQKKAEIKKNLRDLRDKMIITFFMLNALFVVVVFLLQVNKDEIHIKWPLGAKANITYDRVTYEITITKTYLQLEPIGLVFISFFASVLVIQFVAMLFHRYETMCHLLSNTPLTFLRRKKRMTFREKLERAKRQFQRENAGRARASTSSERDELVTSRPSSVTSPAETRKSRLVPPDALFNSIFQKMNRDEERETAEKEERRKSSLFPWRRNSGERTSKRLTQTRRAALERIEEEF